MSRIAIVGAGLSGRLLALNLCWHAPASTHVVVIDRADERSMGPAYSDDADHLLLNVPAARMSALPEDPEHFLRWARERGLRADPLDFLPRRLYREYVFDLLQQARRERRDGPRLEHVRADVRDVDAAANRASLWLRDGERIYANRVVLAIGNFSPRDPPVSNSAALDSPRYVRDPWKPGVLDTVDRNDTVLMIGTGQTTVDLALTLDKRGHAGRVVAISRHGALPMPHRGFEPYPPFFDEIGESTKLRTIVSIVHAHVRRAEATGIDPRGVIDSLRHGTQALWLRLPDEEKRRFVRHVFRHWETIRSRIPPETDATIGRMRATGKLTLVAGRVRDLLERAGGLDVRYTPRRATQTATVRAGTVINCVGPETDYNRVDDPLVKNLLRRGSIRPGPADLGLDALSNGAIVARDGAVRGVLYTLGSPMKGVLWEVLAVPDIRVQARALTQLLVEGS
jgi:uncharacterized NAD(P)/FAD-binding protein YdhS